MQNQSDTLSFTVGGNSKLDDRVAHFSIPAGHTCPGAGTCKAKADRETGKVEDGPNTETRCFVASLEAVYKGLRDRNWRNLDLLKAARTYPNMKKLILESLPDLSKWDTLRIHIGGDFFNLPYFRAWVAVAREHSDKLFYAYTTSGHLFEPFILSGDVKPDNFRLVGSMAGKFTKEYHKLANASAHIVFHPDDTDLPIDHTDEHAQAADHDFALLIHGTQPAGSAAGEAKRRLQKEGIPHSYSSKKKKEVAV